MARFDDIYPNKTLELLEEDLLEAISKAQEEKALDELLAFLATLFDCDRIYLFTKNGAENYDMTHEWCAPGIPHHQQDLQNLHWAACAPYYERFKDQPLLVISDVEAILYSDPELYHILKPQGVSTLISGSLEYIGKDLGFFGIDNIRSHHIKHTAGIMRMLRYFIASILYARREDTRMIRDQGNEDLMGLGNWHQLYDTLDKMSPASSIGVLYLNLIGLSHANETRGRHFGDSLLFEISRRLINTFSIHNIYRIHGDDFVVAVDNASYPWFLQRVNSLKKDLLITGISIEIGTYWADHRSMSSHQLIEHVKERMTDLAISMEDPNAPL